MFVLDVIKLLVLLLSAYIMAILYKQYLPIEGHLSDWTTMLLSNGKEVVICYFGLLLIFFILKNSFKHLKILFFNNKNLLYEKWKGVVLLLLIFDLVFYLIVEYKYFIIPSLFTFIFIKIIIKDR